MFNAQKDSKYIVLFLFIKIFIFMKIFVKILTVLWMRILNWWRTAVGWKLYCRSHDNANTVDVVCLNSIKTTHVGWRQSEHVSNILKYVSSIFRFVGVRSAQLLMAKANAPLMFRSRSPVNQIPLRSRSDIKCLQ